MARKAEKTLWEALEEMADEQVLDSYNKAVARGAGGKNLLEAGLAAGQMVKRGYSIEDSGDEVRFIKAQKAA